MNNFFLLDIAYINIYFSQNKNVIAILTLLLGLALVVLFAWIVEKSVAYGKALFRKTFPEFIQRRELRSYDPDWVLKRLFELHPQKFFHWEIKNILADCVPHDEEVWGRPCAFFWFWVLELPYSKRKRFAYAAGFFDPRQWEPLTIFKIWLFETLEEAAACALEAMPFHSIYKLHPSQELYDFLMLQIRAKRPSGKS